MKNIRKTNYLYESQNKHKQFQHFLFFIFKDFLLILKFYSEEERDVWFDFQFSYFPQILLYFKKGYIY